MSEGSTQNERAEWKSVEKLKGLRWGTSVTCGLFETVPAKDTVQSQVSHQTRQPALSA